MLLIEGTLDNKRKRTHSISIPSTAQPPLLHRLFDPSLPTPGTTDTDFVDTEMEFFF